MRKPGHFASAITVCTMVMTMLYGGLAVAGYTAHGTNVSEIVIFSLGSDWVSRVAAGCILLQVTLAGWVPAW